MLIDGASTIYTSTKTNANIQLLYEYLIHRLYKFDFNSKPNIIDKESYFIPSGYDSLPILTSYDVQNDLNKSYSDRIAVTKTKTVNSEEEVISEDSQSFLKKFYGAQPTQEKRKIPLRDTVTPSKEHIDVANNTPKMIVKGNSTAKLEQFKNQYNTNTPQNDHGGLNKTTSKGQILDRVKQNHDSIKEKEMQNLLNTNSTTAEKPVENTLASDVIKKRLNNLRVQKK
jgi:hypothetical protein